jgi:lysophospholipase L1-like esterase
VRRRSPVLPILLLLALPTCQQAPAQSAGAQSDTSPSRARFIESLKAGQKVTIVTLGTSLTAGTGRWPDVMKEDWLDKDFPGLVTLHNLGVGASASNHPRGNSGLDKVKQAVALKPDVVFIEFATNDAYLPYKITQADSKRNLNAIIDAILAGNPKAEIILQTMNSVKDQPGSGPHATNRPQLAAYFQGYRDVAQERGVVLIDNYPHWLKIMTEDPGLFDRLVPDRIHPQTEGYRQVLLPVLKHQLGL